MAAIDHKYHPPDDIIRSICDTTHSNLPLIRVLSTNPIRAQWDSAADKSTTPHRHLLHHYRSPSGPPSEPFSIGDAGTSPHKVHGIGFLHVPTDIEGRYEHFQVFHIPTIPSTLINPHSHWDQDRYREDINYGNYTGSATHYLKAQDPVHIPLIIDISSLRKTRRLYTLPLLPADPSPVPNHPLQSSPAVHKISTTNDGLIQLWHHRLMHHVHNRTLATLHKIADGVPKMKHPDALDKCSDCIPAKLRRSPRLHNDTTRKATCYGQSFQDDWGFIVQKSKDTTRYNRLVGTNGETAYLLLVDTYSGAWHGICSGSKHLPTEWLHLFLFRVSSRCPSSNKWFLVDEGSELGRSNLFTQILTAHNYLVRTSAPDCHSQIGIVERPHQTIGDVLRATLHSTTLPFHVWPFILYHLIRIHNMVHPSRCDPSKSIYEIITGKRPDLSTVRILGCAVYVRPPGLRPSKLDLHSNLGRFLGYTATMKQIYYLDHRTNRVKTATHINYDEGMNGFMISDLPPFALSLRKALGHAIPQERAQSLPPDDFDFSVDTKLFPDVSETVLMIHPDDYHDSTHSTLGFVVAQDPALRRGFIKDILPNTTASRIKNWRSTAIGAFILSINGEVVHGKTDIDNALSAILVHTIGTTRPSFRLRFAKDSTLEKEIYKDPTVLDMDQICSISQIIHTADHPSSPPPVTISTLDASNSHSPSSLDLALMLWEEQNITTDTDLLTIHVLRQPADSKDTPLPSCFDIQKLSRRTLAKTKEWNKWILAEAKMLDQMEECNMFGSPIPRPPSATVLRSVGTYVIKWDNTFKARHCADGRILKHLAIWDKMKATYAACVSQIGMRLFFAICAMENLTIMDVDATNAFAQSPPPSSPVFMSVDEQYRAWYFKKYKTHIPKGHVLPVLHAIQGHPESGLLWQTKINQNLLRLGFTSTIHEPCIYRALYKGFLVLLLRQIDDMLIACASIPIIQDIVKELRKDVRLTLSPGYSKHYNGIDIAQFREAIKIDCHTYIDKLSTHHSWATGSFQHKSIIDKSQIPLLESSKGPSTNSDEGKLLAADMGFQYRSVFGEILYAYILCRPEFGFSITLLGAFNSCPARPHFTALKRAFKVLRDTKFEGIIFWRRVDNPLFPPIKISIRQLEPHEIAYPYIKDPTLVSATVDASYAPVTWNRKSVGGFFIFLGMCYLIDYKTKVHPITADSSTYAEFVQYVIAAKKVRHARSIMTQLTYIQRVPSPIFGDNIAAILIGNHRRPTERTRHMDIRWFVIQEWILDEKCIILYHIKGTINPSDTQTKVLDASLAFRHISRANGLLGSPFRSTSYRVVYSDLSDQMPALSLHSRDQSSRGG